MEAGTLRHRIELQQPAEVLNEHGDAIQTWTTRFTRWAEVRPATGREIFRAQKVEGQVDTAVTLRGRGLPGLRPKWRVRYGNRLFGIEAIINDLERDIMVTLICKEER